MHLKSIIILLIYLAGNSVVIAEPIPQNVQITREVKLNRPPTTDLLNKKIFVEFVDSPKMTKIIQEKLKAKGFKVIESKNESEAKFVFMSGFILRGAGKEEVRGRVAELIENSVVNPAPGVNYKNQNVDLLQVGVSAAYTGIASTLSLTDMVRWISQKAGIAGRFNEMLTGDPRGFCYGTSCTNYTNSVRMSVTGGDDGHWHIHEIAVGEKIVLDVLIADSLETLLKPFYDLQTASR